MEKTATPSGTATPSDPLVAFRRDRLRAALRAWRISESALATKVGVAQKTINDLVKRSKKGRRSVLEAISEVVQVPMEWLIGENDRLPLQPFQRENPFRALAECQFVIRCAGAYRRDMRRSRRDQDEWKRRQTLEGEFLFAVLALLDYRGWWRNLFQPADWDVIPPGEAEVPISQEAENQTVGAIVGALEAVLAPWFDGIVTLDYERVIELASSK